MYTILKAQVQALFTEKTRYDVYGIGKPLPLKLCSSHRRYKLYTFRCELTRCVHKYIPSIGVIIIIYKETNFRLEFHPHKEFQISLIIHTQGSVML